MVTLPSLQNLESNLILHVMNYTYFLGCKFKVLLFLDMHKSHSFNLIFMDHMKATNVELCCFPPYCTNELQFLHNIYFNSHMFTNLQLSTIVVLYEDGLILTADNNDALHILTHCRTPCICDTG